jgi:Tol biopolymer transport system component/DNA-binding winged helix-turn-helix (wHTH) protein
VTVDVQGAQVIRFATFELDARSGELRKSGMKLKLGGQPFQVLAILLERPGEVVTREELQARLWPDTFVDVDHNLNTAINKIREVLGDSAENPRFVETLPRRGYRFIAPITGEVRAGTTGAPSGRVPASRPGWTLVLLILGTSVLLAGSGWLIYKARRAPAPPAQRTLTRLTFDEGLQIGATWSPDSRFVAYSSDRGGKFDVWVQQVGGGNPVQVTKGPGHNWQPDWSPDGKYIAYRSEEGDGGLYFVPALGSAGLERKIASFGYHPHWSPDSSLILFQTVHSEVRNRFYLAGVDGIPPREILKDLAVNETMRMSAAWHPDGKRVSVWSSSPQPGPSFSTAPIAGGPAIKSEFSLEVSRQIGEAAAGLGINQAAADFKFSWSPSGKAIYFERTFRGAKNIWRMDVDPRTLRGVAIERLTTSPGLDTELSLSPDGKKIAFTAESQRVRAWLFPFDATHGKTTGDGHAVTLPGMDAWRHNLTRDGKKLAFNRLRSGKWELWESTLDGQEAPIMADDSYARYLPQWSPDGTRLAYQREKISTGESQVVQWSSPNREEEPLTAPSDRNPQVFDWSPDGKQLLITQWNHDIGRREIWELPVGVGPHDEAAAHRIISDRTHDLFQPHFSLDGRWIVFEALENQPSQLESTIYVMAAAGGPWIRITDGKHWDDKPAWSPDGKSIYFVSGRGGFFNVWGTRFDPVKGKPVGDAFQVTSFKSPTLMVPEQIAPVELSVTQDRLVVTVAQVSGSIWVLDNVDR